MTLLLALLLAVVTVVQFGYLCAVYVLSRDLKESARTLRAQLVDVRSSAYMLSSAATR